MPTREKTSGRSPGQGFQRVRQHDSAHGTFALACGSQRRKNEHERPISAHKHPDQDDVQVHEEIDVPLGTPIRDALATEDKDSDETTMSTTDIATLSGKVIPTTKKRNGGIGNKEASIPSISTIGIGTLFDQEIPITQQDKGRIGLEGDSSQDGVFQEKPWVIKQCPNEPHPLLEFPPLYWLVDKSPRLLKEIKHLYSLRWRCSYPLQRRVFLSKQLAELLLILPLVLFFVGGLLFAFVWPSTYWSGQIARLPLILALATAMRNSLITLLIGLPFERALWYHKVLGRLTFFNGILHTIVAHGDALEKTVHKFLFFDQLNSSGTGLFLLIVGVTITSFPQVRSWCFEAFYYVHVVFVILMTACAFYHSGILVPILASILWGGDLLCRKIIMACFRYPRTARVRIVSDTVTELSFPKTAAFDYNAGQHLSIAVTEITGAGLEFHPFSIATCPQQPNVSIMIHVAGAWTKALHKLAMEKDEVSNLVEGPNGSPNIDIFSDRYESFLLFSGGIGITPIQSICNQLVYEQNKGHRNLEKIRMVWSDRDACCIERTDLVRRASISSHFQLPTDLDLEELDLHSIVSRSVFNDGVSQTTDLASMLLALVPPSQENDAELKEDLPVSCKKTKTRKAAPSKNTASDQSTFGGAYNNADLSDILDIQVYLSKGQAPKNLANMPFVHIGRPDVEQIFADMRAEALGNGLTRVAVIVCAPAKLARILQATCVKYSDAKLSFDCHLEFQD
ncbi:expressed unknown protein [Seminavis robusta]|uniref:FAD-binding FR-type domain-containing protein n=1 Tax=Seminavis robusta TaxID=568900 RepID=A0A9N8EG84_9STRA|nr:expressed unknown protein [Seminavis robusta]|eukprot:Sro1050_g235500.1 n/a (737) ;mRNA; f:10890-13120